MDKQAPKGDKVASSPIFKRFLSKAEEYIKKPLRIKQLLNDAYQKASDKKDIGGLAHEAWESLQILFRLIRASVAGEYTGLPAGTIVAAVAVVIYFLSPIDIIPDFIPVIGLLDDVALLAWFTSTLTGEIEKFAEWEKTRPVVVADAGSSAEVVTESARKTSRQPLQPVTGPVSATDSGIASPDSRSAGPGYSGAASTPQTNPGVPASTTDSSRIPYDGATDTGGNIR